MVTMKLDLTKVTTMIDGENISGNVYIQTLEIKVAKNLKKYAQGFMIDNKTIVAYKVWGDFLDEFTTFYNSNGPIMNITGKINVFNDTTSIIITNVKPATAIFSISDFISGHDQSSIEKEFYAINERLLSPAAFNILNCILNGEIKERFFLEYAGMKMHDACPSGVSNHTLKMLRILDTLLKNDNRLIPWTDILVLGIDFHDIGKVKELNNGNYTKNSFVSHREFGVELLHNNKDFIISNTNEDFYYRLISIIRGHHDEFEEKAKTVYARIVHLIDMIDAQVSHFLDVVEGENIKQEASGDYCIDSVTGKLYI